MPYPLFTMFNVGTKNDSVAIVRTEPSCQPPMCDISTFFFFESRRIGKPFFGITIFALAPVIPDKFPDLRIAPPLTQGGAKIGAR